jgi:hypothetical protein
MTKSRSALSVTPADESFYWLTKQDRRNQLINKLRGAEPYLRSYSKLPSILRNPGGSSSCSQKPWTDPQSVPSHPISGRRILILSNYLRRLSPSDLFLSDFPASNLLRSSSTPFVLHALPMSFSSPMLPLAHWLRSQIMKLLVTQFSPASYHFNSPCPKLFPQLPFLLKPPLMLETKFHTHTQPI